MSIPTYGPAVIGGVILLSVIGNIGSIFSGEAAPEPMAKPAISAVKAETPIVPPKVVAPLTEAEIAEAARKTAEKAEAEKQAEARWEALTDVAVKMAHAEGLTCDAGYLSHWLWKEGYTLTCNGYRYKYYIEDKGRGWRIRIAD
jgi:hypothetical protein